MMELATVIAQRSTCHRRRVGCVLTDAWGRVLSMGHNGVPRNHPHCTDDPCAGAHLVSGTGLQYCEAVHAEQNALIFCPDVMRIDTCWVTTAPCSHCVKMLMNSTCQAIVFAEAYADEDGTAKRLWEGSNERLMPPRRWTPIEEYEG